LKSGVRSLHAPVDSLLSNGAYMVMTTLAWNLKAWWALSLPMQPGRWQGRHREQRRRVLPVRIFVSASRLRHFPVSSGMRSSNMMAKWFNADFQLRIGIVRRFDASLIAM